MNKKVMLTKNEINKLNEINDEKFKAYQKITQLTHETNQKDAQWWNNIYKKHNLDPKDAYRITLTKEGAFLELITQ